MASPQVQRKLLAQMQSRRKRALLPAKKKISHESKRMRRKASRMMFKEATKQKPNSPVRFIIPCSVLCVDWSSEPLRTCIRRPQFSRG